MKSLFIMLFLLSLCTYLIPLESYRRYIQFFMNILLIVCMMETALCWLSIGQEAEGISKVLEGIMNYEGLSMD